jgi:hypothetical protein
LNHPHQQRSRQTLSRDIPERERHTSVRSREYIVQVAPDLKCWKEFCGYMNVRYLHACGRHQLALHCAALGQLLLPPFRSEMIARSQSDEHNRTQQRERSRSIDREIHPSG